MQTQKLTHLPRFFSNLTDALAQLPHISNALHESCYVLQLNFGYKYEKTQYTVRSCSEMVVRPLPHMRLNKQHIQPDHHQTHPEVYKLAQLPQQLIVAIHEHRNTPYITPEPAATEPQTPAPQPTEGILRNHVDLSAYAEFHKRNMGYNFIRTKTAQVIAKFDMYILLYQNSENNEQFITKLNCITADDLPGYSRIDKPGWHNGIQLKKR